MRTVSYCLVLVLLLSVPASAATINVNPAGGGNATTIQGGVDLALSGDEVLVEPGTYVENVIMRSGVRLVSSSGPLSTVIDGHGGQCVRFEQCGAGSTIQGFTLTNGGGESAGGIFVYDHSNVEIVGNIIRNNITSYEGAGVQIQRYSYAYVHANQFLDNRSYHSCAMSVIVNSQARIEGNLFRGNVSEFLTSAIGVNHSSIDATGNWFIENRSVHGATVHVVHSDSYARIAGNSFVFNEGSSDGGSGIYAYLGAQMVAERNIFAFNRGTAAILSGGGVFTLSCNDVWDNDADVRGIANPVGSNGNIGLDPLICDPLTDDVALSHYSPCLTAACGVIGANSTPGCLGAVPAEQDSWGAVKNAYR